MAAFDGLLTALKKAEQELEAQLSGVRAALSSLGGAATRGRRGRSRPKGLESGGAVEGFVRRKKRVLSAAGRKAIADAQRKRWAKIKKDKKSGKGRVKATGGGHDMGNG